LPCSGSLLLYFRSLLPYSRSLLPCSRSLLLYFRSLLPYSRSLLPCSRSLGTDQDEPQPRLIEDSGVCGGEWGEMTRDDPLDISCGSGTNSQKHSLYYCFFLNPQKYSLFLFYIANALGH
jgi:hypothetical protein